MITKELVEYIATAKAQGVPIETIKSNLLSQGWHEDEIEEATGAPRAPQPIIVPQRSHKKWIFVAGVAVLVLIIAGAAYAYVAGYFTPLDRITIQSMQAAREANSATFDTTTTIEIPSHDTSKSLSDLDFSLNSLFEGKISVTTKGGYDFSDQNNPHFGGTLSIDANKFSAAIEGRLTNKVLYARLTKAPSIAFLNVLKGAENKWVSFPTEADGEEFASLPFASMLPFNFDFMDKLSDVQKQKLVQITEDAHFITITKRLTPEMMSDTLSYHFTFDLDREGIKKYLNDVQEYLHSSGSEDSFLSSLDLSSYGDDLDKIKSFNGEAWIGEKDHLPYKIALQLSYAETPDTDPAKVTFTSIFSGWNEPYTVETPTGAKNFEDFINDSFGGAMEQAREKGTDASIKSNLSNMRAMAELHYDAAMSYKGFCATSDVAQIKSQPYMTAFTCTDLKDGFSASQKLSDGQYFCVDSTGYSSTQAVPPKSVACTASR